MRKIVLALAAAGAALAAATPAAAQYYPQPQPFGYGYNGYGQNGYGFGYGNFGEVRALQRRIDALEYRIRMFDRRGIIRDDRADRLNDEAEWLEERLHRAARYGLNPYEASDIQARLARLERRVQFASAQRYGWYGPRYRANGYYGYDRDRDYDRDQDDRD